MFGSTVARGFYISTFRRVDRLVTHVNGTWSLSFTCLHVTFCKMENPPGSMCVRVSRDGMRIETNVGSLKKPSQHMYLIVHRHSVRVRLEPLAFSFDLIRFTRFAVRASRCQSFRVSGAIQKSKTKLASGAGNRCLNAVQPSFQPRMSFSRRSRCHCDLNPKQDKASSSLAISYHPRVLLSSQSGRNMRPVLVTATVSMESQRAYAIRVFANAAGTASRSVCVVCAV